MPIKLLYRTRVALGLWRLKGSAAVSVCVCVHPLLSLCMASATALALPHTRLSTGPTTYRACTGPTTHRAQHWPYHTQGPALALPHTGPSMGPTTYRARCWPYHTQGPVLTLPHTPWARAGPTTHRPSARTEKRRSKHKACRVLSDSRPPHNPACSSSSSRRPLLPLYSSVRYPSCSSGRHSRTRLCFSMMHEPLVDALHRGFTRPLALIPNEDPVPSRP